MIDASSLYFQPMAADVSCPCKAAKMMMEMSAKNEPVNCMDSALPKDLAVAMAYVPAQMDNSMYDDAQALREGTLFPVLNKPFLGSEHV